MHESPFECFFEDSTDEFMDLANVLLLFSLYPVCNVTLASLSSMETWTSIFSILHMVIDIDMKNRHTNVIRLLFSSSLIYIKMKC